jgi:RND family efflux transporter MFP subunit
MASKSSLSQRRWFPHVAAISAIGLAILVSWIPVVRGAPRQNSANPAGGNSSSNSSSSAAASKYQQPAIAVRLVEPTAGPVNRPIRGTGIVRLKSEADLSFKVGGVVAAVLVEEGARVKKGQILARLDPTEVDAAYRQAREGAIKAERDLDRVKRLHSAGAIAIVEKDNAETGVELARAAVSAASFNAQRAAVIAPDDGRIDRRMLEPGEVVAPGRPVFHLSGRSKGAIVRIGLTDRDALRVKEGDVAKIRLDAANKDNDEAIVGHVAQIATVATPGVGTFDVEVKLELPSNETLLSGLTAKVEIAHEEAAALVVPIGSVVDGRGPNAALFVVEGEPARAKKVPVRVAFILDQHVALASAPIPSGTKIIEAGAADVEDGSLVRVLP